MSIASRTPFLFGGGAKLSSRAVIYLGCPPLSLPLSLSEFIADHRKNDRSSSITRIRVSRPGFENTNRETWNVKRRIHRSRGRSPSRLLLVSWCNKREITWKLRANYKKCVCKRTNLRKRLDGSLTPSFFLLEFLLFRNIRILFYRETSRFNVSVPMIYDEMIIFERD